MSVDPRIKMLTDSVLNELSIIDEAIQDFAYGDEIDKYEGGCLARYLWKVSERLYDTGRRYSPRRNDAFDPAIDTVQKLATEISLLLEDVIDDLSPVDDANKLAVTVVMALGQVLSTVQSIASDADFAESWFAGDDEW